MKANQGNVAEMLLAAFAAHRAPKPLFTKGAFGRRRPKPERHPPGSKLLRKFSEGSLAKPRGF